MVRPRGRYKKQCDGDDARGCSVNNDSDSASGHKTQFGKRFVKEYLELKQNAGQTYLVIEQDYVRSLHSHEQ